MTIWQKEDDTYTFGDYTIRPYQELWSVKHNSKYQMFGSLEEAKAFVEVANWQHLTITISGETTTDLLDALDATRQKIVDEFSYGFDSNETGAFEFTLTNGEKS